MEKFISVKPKNEVLSKYIDSFYFHQNNEKDYSKKIVFFPNTKNALTIYKNSETKIINKKPLHVKIIPSENCNYFFLYGGIQQNYVVSEAVPPFDKIGVVFLPLGMNHFIEEKYLGKILRNDYYFPSIEKKILLSIDKVYKAKDIETRVALLETFFLKQINYTFHEPTLKKAINYIEEYKGKIKIGDLSSLLHVEEKTLLRKFRNHLNCTPKHYAKVFQFREAMRIYIKKKECKNLTTLAISNNYYDQSDFIKIFKKLTGTKPTSFFKNINDLGNDIYWFK